MPTMKLTDTQKQEIADILWDLTINNSYTVDEAQEKIINIVEATND